MRSKTGVAVRIVTLLTAAAITGACGGSSSAPPTGAAGGSGTAPSGDSSATIGQFASATQVQDAVRSSLRPAKLTSDVAKQLQQLGQGGGLGDTDAASCPFPSTLQSTVDVAACTFGDKSATKTMVLLGDSRAQMWIDDFNTIATASHIKLVVLAKTACPAALGTYYLTSASGVPSSTTWQACTAWHTFALKTIKALKPALIVVSSSDNLYLTAAGSPGVLKPDLTQAAFSALFHALPKSAHVAILANFPNPGDSPGPVLCLSKGPSSDQSCEFTASPGQAQLNAATHAATVGTKVQYVDIGRWLCASKCPAVIAGIEPYTVDGFHVNSVYAHYLTGVVWAAVKPYLHG